MHRYTFRNRWHDLAPWPDLSDDSLHAIATYLFEPSTAAALAAMARNRSYPHHIRSELHARGVADFFSDRPACSAAPSRMTLAHIGSLGHLLAASDTSLAITVMINVLALLPSYIAAKPELLSWVFAQIQTGKFAAMLLTEIASGSNVLAGQTWAEVGSLDGHGAFVEASALQTGGADDETPSYFRVFGQKDLINGGGEHELLVVFARTRQRQGQEEERSPLSARGDFSFLLVERDNTVSSPYRWHTLPAPGANIASVAFRGTIVPRKRCIGRVGQGFAQSQKALAVSRGMIGSMAAGLSHRAVSLTTAYAQERAIYGAPILELGAISDHLTRMQALDLLIAAAALRANAMLNARGPDAAHYGAVAKYACCVLLEESVDQGRYLMGSRALLLDHPYHQIIGDALLLSAFDGTTHLVLDQIQWRLAQIASMEASEQPEWPALVGAIYCTAPCHLLKSVRATAGILLIHPVVYLQQLGDKPNALPLAPLIAVIEELLALTCQCRALGLWDGDQGLRFEFGRLFAFLETLIALVELADPQRRQQLGMERLTHESDLRLLTTFTYAWFGSQQIAALDTLCARLGHRSAEAVNEARLLWGQLMTASRDEIRRDPRILTQGYL
jgi:alkylation response protein AidB-like acyl-CoA dehydrogenase